jgi:hypothetical protein
MIAAKMKLAGPEGVELIDKAAIRQCPEIVRISKRDVSN